MYGLGRQAYYKSMCWYWDKEASLLQTYLQVQAGEDPAIHTSSLATTLTATSVSDAVQIPAAV